MTMTAVGAKPKKRATAKSEPKIVPLVAGDLLAAARLMYRTVDDVRVRAGLPALDLKLKAAPSLMSHIYGQEPELSLAAYDGDKLAGFAMSHMRDRQWHVAYLFVDPAYQNRGLGTALLRTGLEEAEKREAYIKSQCTFTYNPKAIALYTRLGMYPRKNLMLMEGPPCKEMKLPAPPETVVPRLIDSTALLTDLNAMDREIRGINRTVDQCYWLADDSHTGYVFSAGGNLVGYAYLSKQGFIAPVLVTRESYLVDVVAHCLNLLAADCDDRPKLWLNGKNFASLQLLLEHRFVIKEIALLMTNRMFCDMRRYLPSSLAVF